MTVSSMAAQVPQGPNLLATPTILLHPQRPKPSTYTAPLVQPDTTPPPVIIMKPQLFPAVAAVFAQQAAGHATFQQLWVDGKDMISLS